MRIQAINNYQPISLYRSNRSVSYPKSRIKPRITEENYLYYYYDIPFEGSTSAGKPLRKLKDVFAFSGMIIYPDTVWCQ